MTDLLSQDNIDQFRSAMRDLTDTFHKTQVTLRKVSGDEKNLLAGVKPNDVGSDGEVNGELNVLEERREMVERWIVAFNRDYLKEEGLVDDDDNLLITIEDWIVWKGKRFAIVELTDRGMFRGVPILVQLTVAR